MLCTLVKNRTGIFIRDPPAIMTRAGRCVQQNIMKNMLKKLGFLILVQTGWSRLEPENLFLVHNRFDKTETRKLKWGVSITTPSCLHHSNHDAFLNSIPTLESIVHILTIWQIHTVYATPNFKLCWLSSTGIWTLSHITYHLSPLQAP